MNLDYSMTTENAHFWLADRFSYNENNIKKKLTIRTILWKLGEVLQYKLEESFNVNYFYNDICVQLYTLKYNCNK